MPPFQGVLPQDVLVPVQFTSSGRGSLSSDGRTNSWASGGRVTTLTQLSQPSGSLPDGHSFLLLPEGRLLEEPLSPGYSQPLHVSEPQKSLGCPWGSPQDGAGAAFEQRGCPGAGQGLLGGWSKSLPGAGAGPGSAWSVLSREKAAEGSHPIPVPSQSQSQSHPSPLPCAGAVGDYKRSQKGKQEVQRLGNPKIKAAGGWRRWPGRILLSRDVRACGVQVHGNS